MSRYGLPDYGMYAALENMGNLVDYGELAARLGSIVSFNREGNIIFWDDFEKTPIKWCCGCSGPPAFAGLSNEEVLSGGQSAKLLTDEIISTSATISRTFPRFASGKQGTEIAFSNQSSDYYLYITIYLKRTTYWYNPQLKIDFGADKIELYASDGQWHDIVTDLELASEENLFHYLKIVIDSENATYTRFMIDRQEINLEEYGLPKQIFPTIESFEVHYKIQNYEYADCKLYLDNFILTQNEP